MDIDFSKVKKSPVPKDSAATNYYRGSGIRIHVYATEIAVHVDGTAKVLTRQGDYTGFATGDVKSIVRAMLANDERKSRDAAGERPSDPRFNTYAQKAEPAFHQTFSFLTSGRTVLA